MPEPPTIHYRNLTRGLLFPHDTPDSRVVRIQSTWCEQKRWDDILTHLGADLYYHLALGATCVIHDVSERERETRACWQGLTWIRYATQLVWYGMVEPAYVRGGRDATDYFGDQFYGLHDRTRDMLKYYRQYADINHRGRLLSCYRYDEKGMTKKCHG